MNSADKKVVYAQNKEIIIEYLMDYLVNKYSPTTD